MENNDIKYKDILKKAANKIEELTNIINEKNDNEQIAVIGYSCRFPGGANNPEKFWKLLADGVDTVTEIKESRFDYKKYYNEDIEQSGKMITKYASFLEEDIKEFDNVHFEISGIEAKSIDPQHRLLLEVSWEAMENSALNIEKLRGSRTGVFIAINSFEYGKKELFSGDVNDITPYSTTGILSNCASGRLSYFYDFKGPSITCDTACSSSIIALNTAVESLRNSQCDMAIVGGVNLLLEPENFIGLTKFGGLSKDGRCKAFDNSADGFGRAEGCGVVILKRFKDAKEDENKVLALVKSVAIGQDGKSNGFSAPNGISQQNLIKQALKNANLNINDIDYIETHGTGTTLGDHIEAQSISEVFKDKQDKMLIGSVKSNIGHLEAAAGMASLIKVLLAIEKKQIPPSIHFNEPNHNINWNKIKVVDKLMEWKKGNGVRRAGISSFGFSGTLAHAIIEEAPIEERQLELNELPYHIMTLSAKNEKALKDYMRSMQEHLSKREDSIRDITYTTNISRSFLKYKYAIIGNCKEHFINKLEESLIEMDNGIKLSKEIKTNHKIAFLFTGQGSIYKDIAKDFYTTSKVFRECINLCNEKFKEILDISFIDSIYGHNNDLINNPIYSQPAIFSVEYGLTKVWGTLGIKPNVIIGHSIGEYAAACYGGLISLDDAIMMIAQRVRVMNSIDIDGKMVGVLCNAESVMKAIVESGCKNVSIAAINAANNVTISGLSHEVDEVVKTIQSKEKVFINILDISHPYHSKMMKKYTDKYNESISNIKFSKLKVNMISSITGSVEKEEVFGQRKYWADHLCNTVNYKTAVESAKRLGIDIFIDIGGDATLTGLASQCLENEEKLFIPTLRKGLNAYEQLLHSVSELYTNNVEINWKEFYKYFNKNTVLLPNYSFNRKKFWIDSKSGKNDDNKYIQDMKFNDSINSYVVVKDYEYKEAEINNNTRTNVSLGKAKRKNVNDIKHEIKTIIAKVAEIDVEEINEKNNLLSLGFDSLLLMSFKKKLTATYNIDISLNEFFLELNTVESIANYIYNSIPEEEIIEEAEAVIDDTNDDFNKFMKRQIKDINKQLRNIVELGRKKYVYKETDERNDFEETHAKTMLLEADNLTSRQAKFIEDFVIKYNSKTKSSKVYAENNKQKFCDWLNSVNFRKAIKELFYPIVLDKAQGEKIWDIDGNEYIDLAIGYGAHYFGHNQKFLNDAVKEQLEKGFALGPQCDLAGKVAELISDLTGVDRVAFCNTGSEAVMVALRIARACSKRSKIVKFAGSYHGTFDGILADSDENGPFPTSRGTSYGTIKDTVTLFYGTNETLEYIKNNKEEIAAVLVEPVQSRRPGFQPKEFLKELREITENENIILIFDEMVNGFRIEQGGAQAYFGIKADIVTYGKIVGGGLPIGVVCGKEKYIDYIDGGKWGYGDDSTPKEETVIFAGTFCKHPLTMATAYATLSYMKEMGNELQHGVNEKTRFFAERANKYFEKEMVPVRVQYFGSQFKFDSYGKYSGALFPIEMDLFFYILAYKGIYTWERRTCCFCTEITYDDIELMLKKIEEAINELRAGGFEFSEEVTINSNICDMSLIQQRIYTQTLLSDKDPYNIVSIYRVEGNLEVKRVEDIANNIIRRHESLRTRLYIDSEGFKQEILGSVDFKIKKIKKDKEEDLDDLIKKSIVTFDLSKAPLFDIVLINVKENEEILIFNFHHTIADGLSMNIFVQEFIKLYANKDLKPLNKNYRDFVNWEKKYLESYKIKASENYWLNKLSGDINMLKLPTDYYFKSEVSTEANTIKMNIDNKTVSGLKHFAKQNSCSLFMVLVATFNILLKKLSGNDDILIGTPVTNRGDDLFEENIGMFTNTIVLRNNVEDEKKLEVFINEVKQNCVNAYANMYYPFNLLVNNINKDKNDGKELINVMLVYENANERIFKANDLEISAYEYKANTSDFDFFIEILEEKGLFNVNLTYKTDLYREVTIKRWGEYYKNIINFILDNRNEDIRIKDIEIVGDEEKHKLLVEFNDTEAEYPRNKTIYELFEKQVQKNPDKVAIVYENNQLTYKELNSRANQLANVLRNEGVKRNSIVGIMIDRSLEMIVAILAILKSGGAYLPIDMKLPINRVNYMIKDSGLKLLVTKNNLETDISESIKIIDITNEELHKEVTDNLPIINSSNDLAYIIYTSGTIGKPKGVMIEHNNVIRLMFNEKMQFNFNENDIWTMFHSYCFDFSVWEMYGALLYGGKLIIVPDIITKDFEAYLTLLKKERVTVLNQTPTVFYNLNNIEINSNKKDLVLRYIIFGGEALKPKMLYEWKKKYSETKIINMYGITETTVHVTYKEIGIKEIEEGISNIGKPIPTLSTYVMDKNLKVQPIGVPGELCVAGEGVARGYLNRKELTMEKFVYNPYKKGERLYQSGDLVKVLPNGDIEYLGRIDHQVKIRGFRIELGEIETKLLEIDGIKEAAAVVREKDENKYLCAYYVGEKQYTIVELKEELKKSLPDYMLPSYFISLEKMPLTTNGKLNKKFLPEPKKEVNTEGKYEGPRNSLEEKLIEIWQDVLNIKNIGINDNFFEVGGHSLKATILAGRIYKELNVEIPLKVIFNVGNIKGLSEYIKTSDKKEFKEVKRVEEKEFYKVSSAQKRMYSMQVVDKNSVAYNMPGALEMQGPLDIGRITETFMKLIKRHETLRTSFHSIGNNIVQKVTNYEQIRFQIEGKKVSNEEEIKHKLKEFIRPFNLEIAPLLRVGVISLGNYRHIIMFDTHHIISDGISMAILTNEFNQLYDGKDLKELNVQYKDYSSWQLKRRESEEFKKQEEYWLKEFGGEITQLDMPTDFERPKVKEFKGEKIGFVLDKELTKELRKIVNETGSTMYMVLLANISILLSKYSGQEDIVIGTPIAGRNHRDLENIIGNFVNTLAIRNIVNSELSFNDYLKSVKEKVLKAYENQDYQFDDLVEKVCTQRNSNRNPLFDIMFAFQNMEEVLIELDGLTLKPYDLDNDIEKFDISIIAKEISDEIVLEIIYAISLFKRETIEVLKQHLIEVIKFIAKDTTIKIKEINISEIFDKVKKIQYNTEFNF